MSCRFQSRKKKAAVGWADFAENLMILIDKAFQHLQSSARQQMALSHYLVQIGNTQIIESNLGLHLKIRVVQAATGAIVGAVQDSPPNDMMKVILEQIKKLEMELASTRREKQ